MSKSQPKNGATPSFNDMIQADRKKKLEKTKLENLAQNILGGGRRAGAAEPVLAKRPWSGPGASLASRVGVTKRSASTTPRPNTEGQWAHDLHQSHVRPHRAGPLKRTVSASQVERGNKIWSAVKKDPANIQSNFRQRNVAEMSIRGIASGGPWVVVASNFAPGTTAADIEAAMAPVGGEITSCRLLSSSPTVMAEMVFQEKDGAMNVIATFNNQKADGRLLYVFLKSGGPTPLFNKASTSTNDAGLKDDKPPPYSRPAAEAMDLDTSRQNPRDDRRHAPAKVQDGRYGFSGAYSSDSRRDYRQERGSDRLYSDELYRRDERYRR